MDENCRKNIISILAREAEIGKVVLHHPFVKVFDGSALEFLKNLASFMEDINSLDVGDGEGKCKDCLDERKKRMKDISEIGKEDPILAYMKIKEEIKEQRKGVKKKPVIINGERKGDCNSCIRHYLNTLEEIIRKNHLEEKIDEKRSSESHYMYDLQPYIRPIFFDTYIHLSPPPDAVFIKKYEIERKGGGGLSISLYSLSTRPEKMYFAIPPEYNLSGGVETSSEGEGKDGPSPAPRLLLHGAGDSKGVFHEICKRQHKEDCRGGGNAYRDG